MTHVDASKGMVAWAKENARSSGLEDAPIRWLVDDCQKFVEREIRRGNHYDAIIMDPPSYGRGPKGEIWKIEDAIHPLVKLCAQLLSDDPLFFLINSYTTGLQPAVLSYMGYLIAETTREEREKIVAESLGNIEANCDGCMSGLAEMYQDYIDGKKELREINMEFNARYIKEDIRQERTSCFYR